jgi:hypothetical protein
VSVGDGVCVYGCGRCNSYIHTHRSQKFPSRYYRKALYTTQENRLPRAMMEKQHRYGWMPLTNVSVGIIFISHCYPRPYLHTHTPPIHPQPHPTSRFYKLKQTMIEITYLKNPKSYMALIFCLTPQRY